MRIWIASDTTRGDYYTIPDQYKDMPIVEIAERFGRCESGEVVSVTRNGVIETAGYNQQYNRYRRASDFPCGADE